MFFQGFTHIKQITVPKTAIESQIKSVKLQPNLSDKSAIPYVEIALPTYVQEFKIPETVDTFPCFWKNAGTIQIRIRLTPCIHPVKSAENATERTALFPVNNTNAREETAPAPKITPEHKRGFLNFDIYNFDVAWKHKMLKIGRITPVKIEIVLLKL